MVKVVFDTNILVSGLLYLGKPKKLMDLAVAGRIELILSEEMINELRNVIAREKFKLNREVQNELVSFVVRLSNIIRVRSKFKVVKEDPDDDKIVRTAYDGRASYIVSGDRHLLELGAFSRIRILRASKMLEILSE